MVALVGHQPRLLNLYEVLSEFDRGLGHFSIKKIYNTNKADYNVFITTYENLFTIGYCDIVIF